MGRINRWLKGIGVIGILLWTTGGWALPPDMGSESWSANLNLTAEQNRILKDLKSQFRQEESQIQKKMMIRRMELRTLLSEELNGEKGEELRRQIQSLLLQARERALFFQQEALTVLTPEQKKKLPLESDLGFHCRGMFHRGGGPGMGRGRGMPPSESSRETGPRSPQP